MGNGLRVNVRTPENLHLPGGAGSVATQPAKQSVATSSLPRKHDVAAAHALKHNKHLERVWPAVSATFRAKTDKAEEPEVLHGIPRHAAAGKCGIQAANQISDLTNGDDAVCGRRGRPGWKHRRRNRVR